MEEDGAGGEGAPPPVAAAGGGWRDVTEDCRRAARALEVGELLCGPDFSLYEAMSALELMDPKMDEALQEPVETVASRLERGALPTIPSAQQVEAVARRLLAHEVAFLTSGSSLLDSLFLCLYAHAPALTGLCAVTGVTRSDEKEEEPPPPPPPSDSEGASGVHVMSSSSTRKKLPPRPPGPIVRDAVTSDPAHGPALALLALILGALKTTHGFRQVVLDADIYEEEDCVPNAFGLYLADNLSDDDAKFLLEKAESLLNAATDSDPSTPPLITHLRLRATLLDVTAAMHAFAPSDMSNSGQQQLHATLPAATAALDAITSSNDDDHGTAAFAFDEGITRALKGNSPRRALRIPGDGAAVPGYRRMLEEVGGALALLDLGEGPAEAFSLERLRTRLEAFSLAMDPSIVPRSFLSMHLLKSDDQLLGRPALSLRVALAEHMAAVGVPVSISLSPPGQLFLHSVLARTVGDALRIPCQNRARQRARLEVLLQDLATVQEHAAAVDEEFGASHDLPPTAIQFLQNWTLEETLRAMQSYLLLGLELGLYATAETDQVLWYLDCLLSIRMQVLQGMQAKREGLEAAEARLARKEEERGTMGGGKGKGKGSSSPPASLSSRKKKGRKGGGGGGKAGGKGGQQSPPPEQGEEVREEWQPTPRADDEALQETQLDLAALRLLCRGLHSALTWLTRARGQPPQAPPAHCPWPERFRRRFQAFAVLRHPEPLEYEDFERNVWSPEVGLERPLLQAQESLRGAKTLLEHALRVKERVGDAHGHALCKALARTAVANAVGLAQAERALQGGKGEDGQGRRVSRVRVGMAWTAHKQLPVLSAAMVGEE